MSYATMKSSSTSRTHACLSPKSLARDPDEPSPSPRCARTEGNSSTRGLPIAIGRVCGEAVQGSTISGVDLELLEADFDTRAGTCPIVAAE